MKRAIKTHSTDFLAIVALLVLAIVVGGYILGQERLRFPFVSQSQYMMNAEFETAQAVTPGQGQSVRVSGVQIGDISAVTLKNGIASVQMAIDSKYRNLIHQDATALLRPRTGLKDMFVELDPGRAPSPVARSGFTIPVSNTNPDVDVDEILASLDSDTREYLQLLINGAGQGLKGKGGNELAGVLKKFEPTHRDLARLNGAVAQRGVALRQLVNSLQRVNTALADKQRQIVSLVVAADKVFHAFASEDGNVSQAIADLPGTLRQTTQTLDDVKTFAGELGPTATKLLPAAEAIPAANAALSALSKPSAPIVQSQIRPFVVAARPLVRNLRPAANKLATATPNLDKTFTVLQHFVNMLGYNPGSQTHGYLWWLAWADHDARSLFENQDANGDYRNLFAQLSCDSIAQTVNGASGALAEVLLNLTPILSDAGLCPTQAKANAAAFKSYEAGKLPGLSKKADIANARSTSTPGKGLFLPQLPTN
ncbi:MAG TPA: MlaD family protein [Solirubrobacteraceae bacterium]|jgi:phospholipid/cholesterol/gamma-HCH transport system substrate-binding protein|nr:MlaD family protein [Solirubrobacteraceae bacterium]